MKILVIGKTGQLGKSIFKFISSKKQSHDFVFVGREELDLNKTLSITSFFNNNSFDVIINCAAYTLVDKAEEEVNLANQVNHLAVAKLAEIAKKQHSKLIHISTDYVFDGKANKPYKEKSKKNPLNVYGKTKLDGERSIQKILSHNSIIIRTSGMYSEFSNNFVDKILIIGREQKEIKIVCDQIVSTTYASDLAEAIITIINSKKFSKDNQKAQIFHYSSNDEVSWYDFAKEVFELSNIKLKIHPTKLNEFSTIVKRPIYSVLDTDKIVLDYNVKTFDWKNSIKKLFASEIFINKLEI